MLLGLGGRLVGQPPVARRDVLDALLDPLRHAELLIRDEPGDGADARRDADDQQAGQDDDGELVELHGVASRGRSACICRTWAITAQRSAGASGYP